MSGLPVAGSAWIHVDDEYPSRSGYYLVYSERKKVTTIASFRIRDVDRAPWCWTLCWDCAEMCTADISHWMPLPDPPAE